MEEERDGGYRHDGARACGVEVSLLGGADVIQGRGDGVGEFMWKGGGVVGSGVSDVTRLGPTCPYMNMDREVSERACVRVMGNQSIATNF